MRQQELYAGDTLDFDVVVDEYPATSGYTLKYRLVPRVSGSVQEITATANGADYAVEVSAASTAAWTAGEYSWTSWVELDGARYTVEEGQLTVKANPATRASGTDTRTQAEIALANIRTTMAGKAGDDVLSYVINGRELRKYTPEELLVLHSFWEGQVARERADANAARGLPRNNKLLVRFR